MTAVDAFWFALCVVAGCSVVSWSFLYLQDRYAARHAADDAELVEVDAWFGPAS